MSAFSVQAAQQGDATKVDKRRKKKQKDAADDAAFLDEGEAEEDYQEGTAFPDPPPCTGC